ncbi:hypothetical protein PCASD_01618 [Puccinia coronata f. sp. avenae]|uniref:PAN2-PAN3 deadenylation complex catalytic subunit PAN2 n=1 Tax=Puccinia coronata f. sp. avenae TaxID=200324 RepID=A0A2N5VIL9_9BASI|nr:hypothetical protein PCASD_01618 [Puccinia coronata f. sp. avenae]
MPSSAPWTAYCSTFLGETAALSFDPYTDLLWTATTNGTVVSHFLPTSHHPQERSIARYSSFKSHSYNTSKTLLRIVERGVFSLADTSLKFTNRRGIPYWFSSTAFQDACSMAFTAPKSIELLIGGAQPELVLLNASTGALVRKMDISTTTAFSPHHSLDSIPILDVDPVSLKEEHSMMAHYAGLEQMEAEGNYLVTCGYSLKQGHPVRDPLVKVFDVRALRPLAPITFSSSPAHVRFHPRMSSTLFITSSTGQLQIMDLTHPMPSSSFYQLDVGSYITDMCISSSGDGLAYVEADGIVHLWTTAVGDILELGEESNNTTTTKPIKWSRGNMPIVLPDAVDDPTTPLIQWTDETPLSSIGMPYYNTELFSVLPPESYITPYSPLYQRKLLPDPADLSLLTLQQRASHHHHHHHQPSTNNNSTHEGFNGGGAQSEVQYMPNPKKTKRYQVSLPTHPVISGSSGRSATARVGSPSHHNPLLISNSKRKLSIPLFRSEKEKEKAKTLAAAGGSHHLLAAAAATGPVDNDTHHHQLDNDDDDDGNIAFDISLDDFLEMPRWYRQVEIKYSKFGIEDFDFGFYNNTPYSGLETHIVNSYTNALLQVLYHTIAVRRVASWHVGQPCTRGNCMLCELGFLFKMMEDAAGVNCQTSNFSRAFSINQRAIALELMDHQHQEFCLHQSQILPLHHHLSASATSGTTTSGTASGTGTVTATAAAAQKMPISSKSYSSLIQLCHHFLLDQIAEDAGKLSGAEGAASLRVHPMDPAHNNNNSSSSSSSSTWSSSPISDIYTMRWQTTQTCPGCQHEVRRYTGTQVTELMYPRRALSNERAAARDLCSILRASMVRETTCKALCARCGKLTHHRWRRLPAHNGQGNNALPTVLALNAAVSSADHFDLWLDPPAPKRPSPDTSDYTAPPRFLQPEIGVAVEPLHADAADDAKDDDAKDDDAKDDDDKGDEEKEAKDAESSTSPAADARILVGDNHPLPVPPNAVIYELRALIVQIQADDETPHLVSLIKVANSLQKPPIFLARPEDLSLNSQPQPTSSTSTAAPTTTTTPAGDPWYLFNDFLVKKISQDEALSFPACWKVPCVLYYVRKDSDQVLDFDKLPSNAQHDTSILLSDINVSKCRDKDLIRHEVLTPDEVPKKGDLVAIDAEFVSLQQEEVDYRSDGTRLVRRPSQMTLARVSVLRGEGSRTGVPFIDDHILTLEPIADYLTEFSGIRPGDLDQNSSPHTLVPLKVAYKKLRLLVDLGCIFIGHGLSKDFRIINIHVPPSQIIDTVDLYYIASRQRKLSLRLLSYLILRHDIQNAGTHDSIEDARTALQLYDIYRQLNNEGVWKEGLENVYRKGKEMGWKVPADKSRSPLPAPAVPPAPLSAPPAAPKLASTLSSSLSARNTAVQGPRFTPSTLSAASATYFPPGVNNAAINPTSNNNPRLLQPVVRQAPASTPAPGEQGAGTAEPGASFYRSVAPNPQAKTMPPAPSFGHSILGPIGQPGPGLYNNSSSNSSRAATTSSPTTTTPVFQRYTTAPPPVFEPKKKAPTFNPMAPSFVLSSAGSPSPAASSSTSSSLNRPPMPPSTGSPYVNSGQGEKKSHVAPLPFHHHHHQQHQHQHQHQNQHQNQHSASLSHSSLGSAAGLPGSALDTHAPDFFPNNALLNHPVQQPGSTPNELYSFHIPPHHHHPHHSQHHAHPHPHQPLAPPAHVYSAPPSAAPPPPPAHNSSHLNMHHPHDHRANPEFNFHHHHHHHPHPLPHPHHPHQRPPPHPPIPNHLFHFDHHFPLLGSSPSSASNPPNSSAAPAPSPSAHSSSAQNLALQPAGPAEYKFAG